MSAHRIVSLLPSATEIVCALGFQDQLVGRSHECDFPSGIGRLPALTSPKFNPEGTSIEINERVAKILAEALAVYRVDADRLRILAPDFIVTQSQCDVCAVSMRDVEEAVAQWIGGAPPKIVSLAPYRLSDILTDIERVAAALDEPNRGTELTARLRQRMAAIEESARHVQERPGVACIEWINPLMSAGNWMPELVAMAGGRSLFGVAGEHSPRMKFEELLACADQIEVILAMPCGFNMERTAKELSLLTRNPQWTQIKAVRSGKVYLADGNQFFNRPGPRIAESLEILAEIFHPELFRFDHEGSGWRRV
jgi:iron complex transport system substrate-binding protein